MSPVIRTVKGKFSYPDGTPMAGAFLRLQLLKSDTDAETGVAISVGATSVELDEEGSFSVGIWPNSRGITSKNFYKVGLTCTDPETGKSVDKNLGLIVIEDEEDPQDINYLFTDGKSNSNYISKLKSSNESLKDDIEDLRKLVESNKPKDFTQEIKVLEESVKRLKNTKPKDWSKDINELKDSLDQLKLSIPKDTSKELASVKQDVNTIKSAKPKDWSKEIKQISDSIEELKRIKPKDWSKEIKQVEASLEKVKLSVPKDNSKDIEELKTSLEELVNSIKPSAEEIPGPFLNDKVAKENGVSVGGKYLKVGGTVGWRIK